MKPLVYHKDPSSGEDDAGDVSLAPAFVAVRDSDSFSSRTASPSSGLKKSKLLVYRESLLVFGLFTVILFTAPKLG